MEIWKVLLFPGGASGKESICQCKRCGLDHWVGKIPWRRAWQLTPVILDSPGESLRTKEPSRLQSMGLQRAGHDWVTKHEERKEWPRWGIRLQPEGTVGDSIWWHLIQSWRREHGWKQQGNHLPMLRTNDRRAVDQTPPFDRAVKEQDAFRRASAFVCWLTDVKALPWKTIGGK